ncbi:MAG: membrane protein insertase YidC [Thermoleophilaceae bacterium]|nr:membrane protein insertase YidC [Thermoleophilaceae bacterium]
MIFAVLGPLQPIVTFFDEALRWFYFDVGIAWGWAIISLTILVRLALVPLTYKQITSMVKMQEHQPEIKALNEKYKEDPKRKQEELMKLFKENKINPLASCLPLLVQMPFFIAMFYAIKNPALQATIEANNPSFFFIDNLVKQAHGMELVILISLYVGSQLAASLVSLSTATDENQRRMMLILPLFFVIFIFKFPAGLLLYWITSNVWTIGQAFAAKKIRHARMPKDETGGGGDMVAAGGAVAAVPTTVKAPPPPPRQKKKRSGRRR